MKLDPRLLRLARSSGAALAVTIALGFAGGVLTVLQALWLSRVVAGVFLNGQALADVADLLGALLAIIALRAALAWGAEAAAGAAAIQIKTSLRHRLYEHLVALGPLQFQVTSPSERAAEDKESSGELVNTAIEGVEALDAYFSQYLPQVALAALTPLAVLVFVFPLDPLSGFVLLLTAPLIPLFMALIGSVADALTKRQWQSLSRMSAYLLDVLQGLTTLKTLGRSRQQAGQIAAVSDRYRQTSLGVLRVTFLSALALELISTLSTAVVAVEIGLRLLNGYLTFEQAFFVLILAPEFYLPLRLLGTRFHAGMAGVTAAGRIFEILDRRPPIPEHRQPAPGLAPASITFDNVSFTYPDGAPGLQGISFELPAGQKTALVGPSGAGKSTIAALLLRFIRPSSGQITSVPSAISYVPQSPYLFNDSIAANLRLARPDATDDELVAAARLAHADEFIRELPQGYATLIGERGARLSGGQAQRLAMARAFLSDAPLLILDEVTSHLDPETESHLHAAIDRLTRNRTVLIIAHRLSTVANADQIIVLDSGRVVAIGRHPQLLQTCKLYQRMVAGDRPKTLHAPRNTPHPSPSTQHAPPNTPLPSPLLPPPSTPPSPLNTHHATHCTKHAPRSTFLRLLTLLLPCLPRVALSVLLGALTIGNGIGLLAASAWIIASAALHPSVAVLQVAIVGVRVFGLGRGLFRYLERLVTHDVTFRLLAHLRVTFYTAIEPLAPARLLAYRSGDLLGRVTSDIAALESFYVRAVAPPLTALLVAAGMGWFMAGYHPSLAVALLGFLLLGGVGAPMLIRGVSRAPGQRVVTARAELSAVLVDGIQGLADLLALGAAGRQIERVRAAQGRLAASQWRLALIGGLQSALMLLAANLGMWTILTLAIPRALDGVALAVLTLAALACFEAVQPLPLAAQHLESHLQAARRLFELVDAPPEVIAPAHPAPPPTDFALEIQNLTFTYPNSYHGARSTPRSLHSTLHALSLTLPPGKRLAIVGPSGAGKTTLVNLLLRFWEADRGQILLGGRPLCDYSPDDLRRRMAVISQHTYLFNATLRDNLLLARPDAAQAEIEQAARQAQIQAFIAGLPQGYDTWVGEHGLRLSGGERQRLAIARALLKDAPLLILDEPTANLDPLTERGVLEAIHTLMQGRSTFWITHRLAGMDRMDEIVVLDRGRVIERGQHRDLLAQGGLYHRMWEIQQGWLWDT